VAIGLFVQIRLSVRTAPIRWFGPAPGRLTDGSGDPMGNARTDGRC
jgi:hypothetical protein